MNESRYAALVRLHEHLYSSIDRAVDRYNTMLNNNGVVDDYDNSYRWHTGIITEVNYNGVVVEWTEYRGRGNYNEGSHSYPIEVLMDATWENAVNLCLMKTVELFRQRAKDKNKNERQQKLAQLESLKKELGL